MRSAVFVFFVLGALTAAAAAETFPYDHIHVNVPDPATAANWYEKYFGGRRMAETHGSPDVRQYAVLVHQEGGREAEQRKRHRPHRLLVRGR